MRNYPEFTNHVIRPIYFVEIDFDDGKFLANSTARDYTVKGTTYKGVSSLGQIGSYQVTSGVASSSLKLTLTNIPGSLTSYVVEQNTRRKRVKVYIALANEQEILTTELICWFLGEIDSLSMDVGKTISIALSATSKLINWNKSINSRYTDEDQQHRYPGDRGFKFISGVQNLKLRWGS